MASDGSFGRHGLVNEESMRVLPHLTYLEGVAGHQLGEDGGERDGHRQQQHAEPVITQLLQSAAAALELRQRDPQKAQHGHAAVHTLWQGKGQ